MHINHLAIWVDDIEKMKEFYVTYFGCISNEKYFNPNTEYTSYFLSFPGDTCRIELMHRYDIVQPARRNFMKGMAHFDITVGDEEKVDEMVDMFRNAGITIASEARLTGDGYYEAGIFDPEGNLIDLSAIRTDI